jgi:phage replication O-like protein O
VQDASPQLENGYTRLANELLEELISAGLTARQWAVVMAIVRKTYGYGKKTDDIGLSQLAEMTGIAKPHVSVAVRELAARCVITREQGKFGHRLGVNKNHRLWLSVTDLVTLTTGMLDETTVTETVTNTDHAAQPEVTDSVTPETLDEGSQIGNGGVTESVLNPVTESVTTKDNPPKDNCQKTKTFPHSLRERFDIFWAAYPRKVEKKEAQKVFDRLNPDDDLLQAILAGLTLAKKTQQWQVKRFIKHPSVWLNGACWQDELDVEYTAKQVEVIAAYNEALGDSLGEIDPATFTEDRAGAIDDFLTFHAKDPNFWQRYFPWVAANVNVPPHCGLDYLISRDGYTKVKGGQFMKGKE